MMNLQGMSFRAGDSAAFAAARRLATLSQPPITSFSAGTAGRIEALEEACTSPMPLPTREEGARPKS